MNNYLKITVPCLLVTVTASYGIWRRKFAGIRNNYCKMLRQNKVDETVKKHGSTLVDEASLSLPTNDRLSELPDDILSHILTYMSLRDVAKLATLSKNWRKLSLSLQCLDLDWWVMCRKRVPLRKGTFSVYNIKTYMNGVGQVLHNYKDQNISSFRLQPCHLYNKCAAVDRWLSFAAKSKHLQSLSLQFGPWKGMIEVSQRNYKMTNVITGSFLSHFPYLKSLQLHTCIVRVESDFRLSNLNSLDLFDVMVEGIQWQDECLITSCTLECLILKLCNVPKKLCFDDQFSRLSSLYIVGKVRELDLTAKNLKNFGIKFFEPMVWSFSCASNLEKVSFMPSTIFIHNVDDAAGPIFDSLAANASKLKSLCVRSANSLVHKLPSCRGGPLFWSVLRLRISFWNESNNYMKFLPHLLKSFPQLKRLELELPLVAKCKMVEVPSPYVHSNLKEVQLNLFQPPFIAVAIFLLQSAIELNSMVISKSFRNSKTDLSVKSSHALSEKECDIVWKALMGKASSPHVEVIVENLASSVVYRYI